MRRGTCALPGCLNSIASEDPNSISFYLKHVWAFDQDQVSKEDHRRTQLYREHFKRETLRRESPTLKDFLAKLELKIDIARLVESEAARVSELTFRTNQFNLTSTKRSVAEISNFLRARQWRVPNHPRKGPFRRLRIGRRSIVPNSWRRVADRYVPIKLSGIGAGRRTSPIGGSRRHGSKARLDLR